jgi:hypothetical protein
VDVSEIRIPDWTGVYARLKAVNVPSLVGLVWDGNVIPQGDACSDFAEFLQGHAGLRAISLARCGTSVPLLATLGHFTQLTTLSIATNDQKGRLDPVILRHFVPIFDHTQIETFDMTGQPIGEGVMTEVLRAGRELKNLRFTGFRPMDAEGLVRVCELILDQSGIVFSEFPEKDVPAALHGSPLLHRRTLARRLDNLRESFVAKFKYQADTRQEVSVVAQDVDPEEPVGVGTTIADSFASLNEFVVYDDETMELLRLCEGVSGVDPMHRAVEEFKASDHVSRLVESLTALDS